MSKLLPSPVPSSCNSEVAHIPAVVRIDLSTSPSFYLLPRQIGLLKESGKFLLSWTDAVQSTALIIQPKPPQRSPQKLVRIKFQTIPSHLSTSTPEAMIPSSPPTSLADNKPDTHSASSNANCKSCRSLRGDSVSGTWEMSYRQNQQSALIVFTLSSGLINLLLPPNSHRPHQRFSRIARRGRPHGSRAVQGHPRSPNSPKCPNRPRSPKGNNNHRQSLLLRLLLLLLPPKTRTRRRKTT